MIDFYEQLQENDSKLKDRIVSPHPVTPFPRIWSFLLFFTEVGGRAITYIQNILGVFRFVPLYMLECDMR